MMFWIKKKKIVVDCFTPFRSVHELYKIRKASVYYPEEFKKMDSYFMQAEPSTNVKQKFATIKTCNGIVDLYKHGFIIPSWTDYTFQPVAASKGESNLGVVTTPYKFDSHPKEQFLGLYDNYMHAKLTGAWKFKEKTGVKFLWQGANWNIHKHVNNFFVASATIWFDTQNQTNVNIFINKDSPDFTISAGTPLVHLIPISDSEVEIKNHLIDESEFYSLDYVPPDYSFSAYKRYNSYLKALEESKQLDKKEKGKCPFGFGK
jgi:hypothetical protein